MSANVERSRAAFEAFNSRDLAALVAMCREDVKWTPPADLPGSRTYVGHDGVREAADDMLTVFADLYAEETRLIDRGDRVVGLYIWRGRGAGSGASLDAFEVQASVIVDFDDEHLVREARFWSSWEGAIQAAGLSPEDAQAVGD